MIRGDCVSESRGGEHLQQEPLGEGEAGEVLDAGDDDDEEERSVHGGAVEGDPQSLPGLGRPLCPHVRGTDVRNILDPRVNVVNPAETQDHDEASQWPEYRFRKTGLSGRKMMPPSARRGKMLAARETATKPSVKRIRTRTNMRMEPRLLLAAWGEEVTVYCTVLY